jgi:threonine dehydrogenase-like Zn-dependent dehydrogenase
MKAVAFIPRKGQIEVLDCERPRISSPGEVALRMVEVGVCATDREIVLSEDATPPPNADCLVIGHEAVGEVVEVGPAVTRVRVGDLVVPTVRRPCAEENCSACRHGRSDFCVSGRYAECGINSAHGFLAEFAVDHQSFLNVVPRDLLGVAVLTQPLAAVEKAYAQIVTIRSRLPWTDGSAGQGPRALILGAGSMGILAAMKLRSAGFTVYAYSREREESPTATLLRVVGCQYVSARVMPVQNLANAVGLVDVVYESTGTPKLSFAIFGMLGANGVFLFNRAPRRESPIKLEASRIMRNLVLKNQTVVGATNAGQEDYEAAIRDLANFLRRWPDVLPGLITHRMPIDEHVGPLLGKGTDLKSVITLS